MTYAPAHALPGRWQAEVFTEQKCIPMKETTPWGDPVITFRKVKVSHVVIFKPGVQEIRFRVNRRGDRPLTFTDDRECSTGIAGSTGLWGTRPPSKPGGKRRSLTPTGFVEEVSRLIGAERAEEIVRALRETAIAGPRPLALAPTAGEAAQAASVAGFFPGLHSQVQRSE